MRRCKHLAVFSWNVMIGVQKVAVPLRISDFNDVRKIALISVLSLVFLWMLLICAGTPMWLQGAHSVRTDPDQLFTGSSRNGTLSPPFSPHGPLTRTRDYKEIINKVLIASPSGNIPYLMIISSNHHNQPQLSWPSVCHPGTPSHSHCSHIHPNININLLNQQQNLLGSSAKFGDQMLNVCTRCCYK